MNKRQTAITIGVVLPMMLMIAAATVAFAAPNAAGDPVRGKYIFAASASCDCHGPDLAGFKPGAAPGQGGEMFSGPFGSVPAPNITQDKATGIVGWTDAQILNAIQNGVDNSGAQLFPVMPYASYHFMSQSDAADLVAYLRTVPAVSNSMPDRKLNGPAPSLPPLPPSPATAPTSGVERGRYLVSAIAVCGDCHTPKTPAGAPDMRKLLAGAPLQTGPNDVEYPSNITPDNLTGIGTWTPEQIAALLKTGLRPHGEPVAGIMAAVVEHGYNQLTAADDAAIASYLKGIPAVSNLPTSGAGFQLGFKTLADLIPDVVGLPVENERHTANGDAVQATTNGLLVWRKADNVTAFTDGSTTWLNGPFGLQHRPNTQRFNWER